MWLTRTFAVYGRLLRDLCDGRPVFWVAMSNENRSLTGQTGTTGRGWFRECRPPQPSGFLTGFLDLVVGDVDVVQQFGPGPEVPSAATFIGYLTVTKPQRRSSVCRYQILDSPRHTHLQPVASGGRRC